MLELCKYGDVYSCNENTFVVTIHLTISYSIPVRIRFESVYGNGTIKLSAPT